MLVGRNLAVGGCLVALAACAPVEVAPPPALPAVPRRLRCFTNGTRKGSTESPASSSISRCSEPRSSLEGNTPAGRSWQPGKRDSGRPPETIRSLKKSLTNTRRSTAELSTPREHSEGRRRCPPGHSAAGGSVLVCPDAVLDAPDLARHRDACRTDTPAGQSGLTRVHSLAASLRNSALSNGADRNAGPHHPLRS